MYDGVMLQGFHWYLPADGGHWAWLADQAEQLAARGFTAVWLPPVSKAANANGSVGYDGYDFWDLGEFAVKWGDARTKHGPAAALSAMIDVFHDHGIQVYADLVFNHKMGADHQKKVWARHVDPQNRNQPLGDWHEREIWSEFDFDVRIGAQAGDPDANRFRWNHSHFDAFVDGDGRFFQLSAKDFRCPGQQHHGDMPFLMGMELNTSHPDVRDELNRIGDWLVDAVGFDGFRIDAVKHIRQTFFPEFLGRLRGARPGRDLFAVGEYWEDHNLGKLTSFVDATGGTMSLFDFRLRRRFYEAAEAGSRYPLHTLLHDTLVTTAPTHAVTFVDNHDLQPYRKDNGQYFDKVKHDWFKPLAYAAILLRPSGYPCVFFGDYFESDLYNADHAHPEARHGWMIDRFLEARQQMVGYPYDKIDHPNCIGWISQGDTTHKAVAVVMSNADAGWKDLPTRPNTGPMTDITGHISGTVTPDPAGGETRFDCPGGKVSVWVEA